MSNDEFETWLSLVGRLLGLSERQRKLIGEELRDHLESRVAELTEGGMDRKAAVMQAVEEFGDAAAMARNLQSVSLRNRKRWMMRFMTFATAGVFLLALLTMAMWPENARFGSPSRSIAQDNTSLTETEVPRNTKTVKSQRTMADARIRQALNQSADLVFYGEAFGNVMQRLKELVGANVVIDINLDGIIDQDSEVSANLSDIRLADGLRTMLKKVDATFVVKDGILLIISIDDEGEPDYLTRQMIDVRETLRLIKLNESDRIGKPIVDSSGGFGVGNKTKKVGLGGSGLGGGGGVFRMAPQGLGGGGLGATTAADDIAVDSSIDGNSPKVLLTAEHLLVQTIQRVVHSDSWDADGGGNGDLTCIGGVLVLVSSEAVAEEVRDFIVDLECQMKNAGD